MEIHVLQHVDAEGPGLVGDWAAARGHTLILHPLHRGAMLPPPESVTAVLVLGGPMNIYEHARLPWLVTEKAWLKAAITHGARVLGICLGAQLIADTLGAPTTRNRELEIGWFPIQVSRRAQSHPYFRHWPETLDVLHWHGDTFAIPDGALPLASSKACDHQGYLYGDRVVGLQFHIEFTPAAAHDLIAIDYPAEAHPFVQPPDTLLAGPFDTTALLLNPMLDGLFSDADS